MEQLNEEDFANLASIQSYLAGDRMPVSPNDFPRSLKEAKAEAEWPEWKRAMDEEIHTIQEMGTYTLEDLPKEREAIGSKWVFSKKYDENGNVSRYKAQLVAQGYSQILGVDFYETFAPVA
ncbi:uncharacterized protein ARMOST_10053 [Armillaria ostoyae]|uniref:Reverse transcriptase Ty1/copia-type domain-containing protein n=1 Tax=Armillaria ostoyae TaxID=47428 RepID=A0A284RD76_ARMOS|nr:uncharacterized protein ARMOST_10053 [Armillaria ostoyae]